MIQKNCRNCGIVLPGGIQRTTQVWCRSYCREQFRNKQTKILDEKRLLDMLDKTPVVNLNPTNYPKTIKSKGKCELCERLIPFGSGTKRYCSRYCCMRLNAFRKYHLWKNSNEKGFQKAIQKFRKKQSLKDSVFERVPLRDMLKKRIEKKYFKQEYLLQKLYTELKQLFEGGENED